MSDYPGVEALYQKPLIKETKKPDSSVVTKIKPLEKDIVTPDPEFFLDEVSKYLQQRKGNIGETFTGTEIISSSDKNSTSSSVLVIGDIKTGTFTAESLIKIGFDYQDVFDNRNRVEVSIYDNIITDLLKHTPHLLEYYGSYPCETIKFGNASLSREFKKQVRMLSENEIDPINVRSRYALFLERTNGKNVGNYLSSLSERNLVSILFQVFYTLKCFENVNLVHGDLHMGNILYNDLPYSKAIYYEINGLVYRLPVNRIVKIFDFDRSKCYNPKVERNFTLDGPLCDEFGQCNLIDNKFDAYLLLSSLYMKIKRQSEMKDLVSIIRSLISTDVVEKDYKEDTALYKYKTRHNQKCKSIDDCLEAFMAYLIRGDILEEVSVNPVYKYKIPEKRLIQKGNPKMEIINAEDLDYSMLPYTPPARLAGTFTEMVEKWNRECMTFLSYVPRSNVNKLLEAYLNKLGENFQTDDFIDQIENYIYYLCFPMFYKMNDQQINACLSDTECSIIGDIIDKVGKVLPINMPLI